MIEEDVKELEYKVRDLEARLLTLEDFAAGRKYKETKLAEELAVGEIVLFGGELLEVVEVDHENFRDYFVKFSNGRKWSYHYYEEARVYHP